MHPPLTLRTDPDLVKPREAARLAKEAGQPAGRWKALSWPLAFFKGDVRIVELSNDDAPEGGRQYFIQEDIKLSPVSFDTSFTEGLASRFGLNLTRDTADDYVRFYLAFARGRAGRVLPVDQVDQLPLREELTLITRRKLQSAITPMTVDAPDMVTGCFLIHDKLFGAKARIAENGTVSLDPGSVIADTLPVLDGIFEAS